MIQRLFVNNYRCLVNFELSIGGKPSVLLIGNNGSGKTTVRLALEVLQKAARGTNRVRSLVGARDFWLHRSESPMRFEVVVDLDGNRFAYVLALEFPPGFRELRVLEESLTRDGEPIFTRELSKVAVFTKKQAVHSSTGTFGLDWHLVALPVIQALSEGDSIAVFRRWLARTLILAPVPSGISGESSAETLEPDREVSRLGEWFSGLIAHSPAVYSVVDSYLKDIIPDLVDIKNPLVGEESRSLTVQFRDRGESTSLPFVDLSDGEKCFFVSALVLAASQAHGPVFCFWDEPESHLSLSEVGHFVVALRRAFEIGGGQLVLTSHNAEAIRKFSGENTLLLHRPSHLEPARVQPVDGLDYGKDLVDALIRNELRP